MAEDVAVAELIARLEMANEGDDRLDYEIQELMDIPKGQYPGTLDPPIDYTRSLDSALTLVPEGAVWHVMTDYGGLNRAKIGPAGRPSASIYHPRKRDEIFIQADAETPALALCIAALKARQTVPQPKRVELSKQSNTDAAQEPTPGST